MVQSLINSSNLTDYSQLPALANQVTGGYFWTGILHMLWAIAILVMLREGFEFAFMAASFGCLILATLMVFAGLVSWLVAVEFLAFLLFMFLYVNYANKYK